MIDIRAYEPADANALWCILEPIIRGGEVFALSRDMDRDGALDYWCGNGNEVFVAIEDGELLGTAFMRDNLLCPNSGVANAGYATAHGAQGRGIARALCLFTLQRAEQCGFKVMQFNYVVSTNERAFRLWKRLGFEVRQVLNKEFEHPTSGRVDVLVMARSLAD